MKRSIGLLAAAALLVGSATRVAGAGVDSIGESQILAARGIDAGDEHGIDLLRTAFLQAPDDDMIRLSLVNELARGPLAKPPDRRHSTELRDVLVEWPAQSPDNAIVWYLAAWQHFSDGDLEASVAALHTGNAAPRCESFARQRFLAVRAASERIGHTRVAASLDALGQLDPMRAYRAFSELCKALIAREASEPARRACHGAGLRIEGASQNILETLMGLLLQEHGARGSGWPDEPALTAHVRRRRDEMSGLINQFGALDLPDAEQQRYFDVFVDRGEESAMRSVLGAHPRETECER